MDREKGQLVVSHTVEELNALRSAYARGALKVRMGDEEVTYESGAEIRRRIGEIERALGLSPTGGATPFANPTFSRGL